MISLKINLDYLWSFLHSNGLVEIILTVVVVLVIRYITLKKLLPTLPASVQQRLSLRTLSNYLNSLFLLILTYTVILLSGLDVELFKGLEGRSLMFSELLIGFCIIQAAFLINYIFSKTILSKYRDEKKTDELVADHGSSDTQSFKYVLIVLALKFMINLLDVNICLYQDESLQIHISDILKVILIVLLANFISFLFIKVFLHSYYKRKNIKSGSQYSINELIRYLIYIILILIGIESTGIDLKVLWGGLAALMVGIGFGLQTIFSDLVSGIAMLFERSVEVGNTVMTEGKIGLVRKIGLRTSKIELRDGRVLIVPNSKIVNNVLQNWDRDNKVLRNTIKLGVAYGTDVDMLKKVLIAVVKENPYVESRPKPIVRFVGFGNSSLDFELLFWSRIMITIEDVKSDLRYAILDALEKDGIEIPFPQRDIWIRSKNTDLLDPLDQK